MLELQKATQDMEKYLANSRKGYSDGWSEFRSAEKAYKIAENARERMLQKALEEKGLAVCCGFHNTEGIENPTAEQLGIFAKDKMRLHFVEMGPYDVQGEYEDKFGMTKMLILCCPNHFPQDENWKFEQRDGFTNVDSEVVQKGEKFILSVNGMDITNLVNKGGYGIEPNGRIYMDPAIYKYFGIPDLPEKPDLDRVKY